MNADGSETLILDGCQMMTNYRAVMHHEELRMPKVQYLVFGCCFVFVQVSMFDVQSNVDELVSMMERIPCCIVDGLYGECELWHLAMVGVDAFGKQEDGVKDELYEGGSEGRPSRHLLERTKFYFKTVMLL